MSPQTYNRRTPEGIRNLLEEAGLIGADDLKQAVKISQEEGMPLKDTIVKMGYVEEDDILQVLSRQLDMEMISLADREFPPEVIRLIDKDVAARFGVMPVELNEETREVVIALSDPFDVQALDDVTLILQHAGYRAVPKIAREEEIRNAIQRYYTGAEVEVDEMLRTTIQEQTSGSAGLPGEERESLGSYIHEIEDVDLDENEAPIVKLVNLIFQEALRSRASDIHF